MEEFLRGCEGIVVHQNDILIFGLNMQQHDRRLENILKNPDCSWSSASPKVYLETSWRQISRAHV